MITNKVVHAWRNFIFLFHYFGRFLSLVSVRHSLEKTLDNRAADHLDRDPDPAGVLRRIHPCGRTNNIHL